MLAQGSVRATFIVLAASSIGTGILTLPWAIMESGLILGPALLVMAAIVCNISCNILMFGAKEADCATYSHLVIKSLKWRAIGPIIDFLIFIEVILAVACYLIFLGDFVPRLVADFPTTPTWLAFLENRNYVIIAFAAATYPICLPSKLSFLRYGSIVSVLGLLYVTAAVVFRLPHYVSLDAAAGRKGLYDGLVLARPGWGALRTFLISIYAFFCHFNVIPASAELKNATPKRMVLVNGLVSASLVVLYLFLAVGGYLCWGPDTQQDFINNYPKGDVAFSAARMFLTFTMIIMIPLQLYPMFSSLLGLLGAVGIGVPAGTKALGTPSMQLSLRCSEDDEPADLDEAKFDAAAVPTTTPFTANRKVAPSDPASLASTNLSSPLLEHGSPKAHPHSPGASPHSSPRQHHIKMGTITGLGNLALGTSLVHEHHHVEPIPEGVIVDQLTDSRQFRTRSGSAASVLSLSAPLSNLDTPVNKALSVGIITCLNVVLAVKFTKIANLIALIGGTFDTLFVITLPLCIFCKMFAHKVPKIASVGIIGLLAGCTMLCFTASLMILWETLSGSQMD